MRNIIVYTSLLIMSAAQAATVTKCVDDTGKLTFSQHGCPASSISADTLNVDNSAPSGSSKRVQMAPSQPSRVSRAAQPRSSSPNRSRSCSRCRFR